MEEPKCEARRLRTMYENCCCLIIEHETFWRWCGAFWEGLIWAEIQLFELSGHSLIAIVRIIHVLVVYERRKFLENSVF